MDNQGYLTTGNELQDLIKKVDARRALEQAAIRSFAVQFDQYLNVGGSVVQVGTMKGTTFVANEFVKGSHGGIDFHVQIKFSPAPNLAVYPTAKLNMELVEAVAAFRIHEYAQGKDVMVPYVNGNMTGVFNPAYALVTDGIKEALEEFRSNY